MAAELTALQAAAAAARDADAAQLARAARQARLCSPKRHACGTAAMPSRMTAACDICFDWIRSLFCGQLSPSGLTKRETCHDEMHRRLHVARMPHAPHDWGRRDAVPHAMQLNGHLLTGDRCTS